MSETRKDTVPFQLGQLVRRRDGAHDAAWGIVIGLILTVPLEALVRWQSEQGATFEVVEGLVDAIQALL